MARVARGEPRDVPRRLAGDLAAAVGPVGLDYEAAIEEALCFGWVDSTGGRVDDDRGKLYFAPRKPRSVWAATNKARVERLIAAGRMAPAGLAAIERAKANGSWEILDSVERLEVPEDLAAALERPPAGRRQLRRVPAVGAQDDARLGRARAAAGDARGADRGDRRGGRPQRTGPAMRHDDKLWYATRMLTVAEAARRAGKNPETIRRRISSGRLKTQRIGTRHVIEERDLGRVPRGRGAAAAGCMGPHA